MRKRGEPPLGEGIRRIAAVALSSVGVARQATEVGPIGLLVLPEAHRPKAVGPGLSQGYPPSSNASAAALFRLDPRRSVSIILPS